jgi:hypothetical protein
VNIGCVKKRLKGARGNRDKAMIRKQEQVQKRELEESRKDT